jgi:hypothetical protein
MEDAMMITTALLALALTFQDDDDQLTPAKAREQLEMIRGLMSKAEELLNDAKPPSARQSETPQKRTLEELEKLLKAARPSIAARLRIRGSASPPALPTRTTTPRAAAGPIPSSARSTTATAGTRRSRRRSGTRCSAACATSTSTRPNTPNGSASTTRRSANDPDAGPAAGFAASGG